MSEGKHSYVRFFPSDWIAGTARMGIIHRAVYFEICCYIWDHARPCPEHELPLMFADLPDWENVVELLIRAGKLSRTDEGLVNDRAMAEATRAFDTWESKSGAGQRGSGRRWGTASTAEANRKKRSERLAEARKKATHTDEQWASMLEFHAYQCVTCGASDDIVKDHIVPIYQGGSDGIENLQPMCRSCNSRKGPEKEDRRTEGWQNVCQIAETPNKTPDTTSETPGRAPTEPEPEPEPEKTPQSPPMGGVYTEDFEQFWTEYPKRVGKGGAFKVWKKLPAADRKAILGDLPARRRTHDPWLRDGGKYIPNPSTYLNQRRWEDDIMQDEIQGKPQREVASWI